MNPDHHKQKAQEAQESNKKLINHLRKKKPKHLDQLVHQYHEDSFRRINCLDCANCCKSISPIITDKDIQRISKHLKTKPSDFTEKYLLLDTDGDYVFKSQPCPFLGHDNYCSIYTVRPKACAEYPHTDRRKFVQILNLSLQNTLVCPAVEEIFSQLRKDFQF